MSQAVPSRHGCAYDIRVEGQFRSQKPIESRLLTARHQQAARPPCVKGLGCSFILQLGLFSPCSGQRDDRKCSGGVWKSLVKMKRSWGLCAVVFGFVVFSPEACASTAQLPVVLWHGMGDSCCASYSLGAVKQFIQDTLGGKVPEAVNIVYTPVWRSQLVS